MDRGTTYLMATGPKLPAARRRTAAATEMSVPDRKPLPNILELITFNDAPYHPDGDTVRMVVAGLMGCGLLAAAATADPWAQTFLLLVFGPECLRRFWLALPRPVAS